MTPNQFKDYDKLCKAYLKYLEAWTEYFAKYPPVQTAGVDDGPGTLPPPPPPPPPPHG